MTSIYRYVVFAPGKQPTVEEVDKLQTWSTATKQPYAVGINADDGALAFAFSARAFESMRSARKEMFTLIERWQVRGCEVRERLRFIKQPTALQPIPGDMLHGLIERHSEPSLKRKQLAAQEAIGRAGLKLQRKLDQHALLTRVAQVVPYALMVLVGVLVIAAGIYTGQRLLQSPTEHRQETILRVVGDAMEEKLARQANERVSSKQESRRLEKNSK